MKKLCQTQGEAVLLIVFVLLIVLEYLLSKGLAVVEALQHRIAVADVAEIL